MRLLFRHIRLAQIALLAVICLAACTHEDVFDAASNGYVGPAESGESYISLTLSIPHESTRALPHGGEVGDGTQQSQLHLGILLEAHNSSFLLVYFNQLPLYIYNPKGRV